MFDFLNHPLTWPVLWVGVLVILSSVGFYALRKLRERIDNDQEATSDLLSNFRELHHQGDLSDAEFRTIKTALGAKLQAAPPDKSKDNSNKG